MSPKNLFLPVVLLLVYYTQTGWADGRQYNPANPNNWQHVLSWQVEHPVLAGMASGLTFGLWPAEYGNDALDRGFDDIPADQQTMMTRASFQMVKGYSQNIFEFWRTVVMAILGGGIGLGLYRLWKRKP